MGPRSTRQAGHETRYVRILYIIYEGLLIVTPPLMPP